MGSVGALITVLVGFIAAFFYKKSQYDDAKSQLQDSETKQKDAALGQQVTDLDKTIAQEQKRLEDSKKTVLTNDDLIKALNDNLKE